MTIQPLIKPVRVRSANRLSWCRKQPCILIGKFDLDGSRVVAHICGGPVEASHIRAEGHGGLGTKPSDFDTLPKCHAAHSMFHSLGRARFAMYYSLDLDMLLAHHNARYYAQLKPATSKPRKQPTHIIVEVNHCSECHQRHRYQFGTKAEYLRGGVLRFWCDRKSGYVEVAL